MNEVPNGTNVVFQRFGKRQDFSHKPRHSLSQGVVESLNVASFACFLTNGCRLRGRTAPYVAQNSIYSLPAVRLGNQREDEIERFLPALLRETAEYPRIVSTVAQFAQGSFQSANDVRTASGAGESHTPLSSISGSKQEHANTLLDCQSLIEG